MVLHLLAFSLVGTTEKIICFMALVRNSCVWIGSLCSFNFYFQLTRKRKSLQVKVQPKKVTQSKKGTQPAKEETSDDSSDGTSDSGDDSSSDDEPAKKPTTLTKKPAAVVSNGSKKVKSDSSSSDSSSDDESDEDEVSICYLFYLQM
jgi:hypothetical protein